MKPHKFLKTLAFSLLFLLPFSAQAAVVNLVSLLSGANEVPANASTATGSAALTLDTTAGTLGYLISFSGLSGSVTAAHFHAAPVGVVGSVIFDLGGSNSTVSGIGSSSGLFVGAMTNLTALQISAIQSNGWYVNLHTAAYPGGEIRGQIVGGSFVPNPVPLPASAWLMVSALGAAGLVARRRQTA